MSVLRFCTKSRLVRRAIKSKLYVKFFDFRFRVCCSTLNGTDSWDKQNVIDFAFVLTKKKNFRGDFALRKRQEMKSSQCLGNLLNIFCADQRSLQTKNSKINAEQFIKKQRIS